MKVSKIVTHEFPDFDCLYSIYLLKKFGEERYPGIKEAELCFVPAGSLPDGETGDSLLQKGTMTLDIQGGHYDHHGDLGNDQSTTRMVAVDLDISEDPCLQKILDFVDQNDLQGLSVQSRQAVDHLISIPNLIKGLNLKYEDDYARVYNICQELFDAAYLNEYEWFVAIDDIQNGSTHRIGNFNILSFASESTASAKAGRFQQGDLCIIHGKNSSMNLTTRRSKKWPEPDLTKMARIVRLAEALRSDTKVDEAALGYVGTHVDWFLHQSLCFLSRGSFKKTDVPPSNLKLNELHQLAIFCFDPQSKYLGPFSDKLELFQRVLNKPMSSQLNRSNKHARR